MAGVGFLEAVLDNYIRYLKSFGLRELFPILNFIFFIFTVQKFSNLRRIFCSGIFWGWSSSFGIYNLIYFKGFLTGEVTQFLFFFFFFEHVLCCFLFILVYLT